MDDSISKAQPVIDHRFGLAAAAFRLTDHNIDVVFLEPLQALRELRRTEVCQSAVDARAAIAETACAGDHFFVKSLPTADDRTQNHHVLAAVGTRDAVENLASAERTDLAPTLDAVLFADLRVEQAQIMVDLRHGRNG